MTQSTLTLLVRDPHCLFAFWETQDPAAALEIDEVEELGAASRAASPRVARGCVARAVLSAGESSRYIEVSGAGRSYVGRLVDARGRCLAQSEIVRTPRLSQSASGGAGIDANVWDVAAPAHARSAYVSSPGFNAPGFDHEAGRFVQK